MFKPGHHIGRPKGSKDQSWAKLTYWFELLKTELNKKIVVTERTRDGNLIRTYTTDAVDPNKRAQLFLDAMKMLCSKAKQLPVDPDDSLANVNESMELLKQLEKSKVMLNNVKPDGIAIRPNEGSGQV